MQILRAGFTPREKNMVFACFVFQSKFCSAAVHISPGGFKFLDVTRIKQALKLSLNKKVPFLVVKFR